MSTTITTRLAAQKAATVDPQGAATENPTKNSPEDVRYDASKQLETDCPFDRPGGRRVGCSERSDANQRDRP
eukprot:4130294-Ditylum_brightwellii.AAC.1